MEVFNGLYKRCAQYACRLFSHQARLYANSDSIIRSLSSSRLSTSSKNNAVLVHSCGDISIRAPAALLQSPSLRHSSMLKTFEARPHHLLSFITGCCHLRRPTFVFANIFFDAMTKRVSKESALAMPCAIVGTFLPNYGSCWCWRNATYSLRRTVIQC